MERQESIFSRGSEAQPVQPVDERVEQALVRATTRWRTEERAARK